MPNLLSPLPYRTAAALGLLVAVGGASAEDTPRSAADLEAAACWSLASSGKVVARPLPAIIGEDGCGAAAPVELEAVILKDGSQVKIEPAAPMRCDLAAALAGYLRDHAAPQLAATLKSRPVTVRHASTYACRTRNGVADAPMSEHARANAIDIAGYTLADGREIALAAPEDAAKPVLAVLEKAACGPFTTVLGVGADATHKDHMHLDLARRGADGKTTYCRYREDAEAATAAKGAAEAGRTEAAGKTAGDGAAATGTGAAAAAATAAARTRSGGAAGTAAAPLPVPAPREPEDPRAAAGNATAGDAEPDARTARDETLSREDYQPTPRSAMRARETAGAGKAVATSGERTPRLKKTARRRAPDGPGAAFAKAVGAIVKPINRAFSRLDRRR